MYDIAVNMFIYTLINSVNSSLMPQCVCLVCKKPFYKTVFNTRQMKPDISTLILYLPLHITPPPDDLCFCQIAVISRRGRGKTPTDQSDRGRILFLHRPYICPEVGLYILEFKQKYFCIFFIIKLYLCT